MSVTISFRVEEEIREEPERRGRNPPEVARQAFLEAVEQLRREAALDRLEDASKEPEEPVRRSLRRGRA